jgi:hypothetical protein
MKMPTIHCMDNGKILCGNKKANHYMEKKDFEKSLKDEEDFVLDLGGCDKCKSVLESKNKKSETVTNAKQ